MATRTRNSISAAWTSAFRKSSTALPASRTIIQDQSIQRTFSTSALQQKQGGGAPGWPQDPASKTAPQSSCNSIPSNKQSQQQFERHLKFLAGPWKHRPKQSPTPLPSSKWQITSASNQRLQHSDETAKSTDAKINIITPSETKKWKRFRPGFQPGDFICSQCGSHNFRPPEHDMAALANSAMYIKRQQPEQGGNIGTPSSASSSSHDMEVEGNTDTTSTSDRLRNTVTEQQKLTQHQVRTVPRRKYPLGASARCFECGFETSYKSPVASTSAKISPPLSSSSLLAEQGKGMEIDKDKDKDNNNDAGRLTSRTNAFYSGSADPLRSDIRISKPKNYVCPQCQTVNFNNRLHCIGCGVLAPWIRGTVERGVKGYHRSASGRKGRTHAK